MDSSHLVGRRLLILGLICLVSFRPIEAQDGPPSSSSTKTAKKKMRDGGVVEVDTITHLFDAFGRLVPVPALRLEQWEHILDVYQKLVPPVPAYAVQQVEISGRPERPRSASAGPRTTRFFAVDVKIKVRIVRSETENVYVRVPLGFERAILRQQTYSGNENDSLLKPEAKTKSWLWWIKGKAGSMHTLDLQFAIPVNVAGEQYKLTVNAPLANSKVKLQVPGKKAVSLTTDYPVRRRSLNGQTQFQFDCNGGKIEFAWRTTAPASRTDVSLSANSVSHVTVFSQELVRLRGELKVRSSGGPIKKFRVRLPPDTILRPVESTAFELVPVAGRQELMDVVLADSAATEATVSLVVEYRSANARLAKDRVELAGFEVLNAIAQRSFIDIGSDGDWSLQFTESEEMQRVATIPAVAREQGITHRYQFSRFPCSLKVKIQRERTRVRIEPTYVYFVDADQMRFLAILKCNVRGNGPAELQLDLDNWSGLVVSSNPASVLAQGVDEKSSSPLRLQLSELAQLDQNQFEIQIQANRELTGQIVALEVPRPKSSGSDTRISLAPPRVVISTANNVELTPDSDSTRDLVQDLFPPTLPGQLLLDRSQRPLYYRGSGTAPRFVAAMDVRTRTVSVGSETTVTLEERAIVTKQILTFNVAYEPIRSLILQIPSKVRESQLQIELLAESEKPASPAPPVVTRAQPLQFDFLTNNGEAALGSDRDRIRVNLPGDQIEVFRVRLTHTRPAPSFASDQSQEIDVGLAIPSDELPHSFTRNYVRARFDARFQVEPIGQSWDLNIPPESELLVRGLSLKTDGTDDLLALNVSRRNAANPSPTVVTQSWLQTHLTANSRQDRAVFRIRSPQKNIRVTLPRSVLREAGSIQIALNHRQLAAESYTVEEEQLDISIPEEALATSNESYLLEIWYWFGNQRPSVGRMVINPPKIEGAQQASRFFWQLVTPPSEHLFWAPRQLTPEQQWTWKGFYFGRSPVMGQPQVEKWIGATPQDRLPRQTNQYLYSSIGAAPPIVIHTARRSIILFLASGSVLALGLLLQHVPALRHPSSIFAMSVVALAAAAVRPELGVFVGQAASLGGVLLFFGYLLYRYRQKEEVSIAEDPLPPPSTLSVPSPRNPDSSPSSTESTLEPAEQGSQTTTITSALPVQFPAADS